MADPTTPEGAFARHVAEARRRRGLSQADLAAALTGAGVKIDSSAVSRIESGTRSIGLGEAVVLARVLGGDLNRWVRTNPAAEVEALREALARADTEAARLAEERRELRRRLRALERRL